MAISVLQQSGQTIFTNTSANSADSFVTTPFVGNHVVSLVSGLGGSGTYTITGISDNQTPANTYAVDKYQAGSFGEAVGIASAQIEIATGAFTVSLDHGLASGNYGTWESIEVGGLHATGWFDESGGATDTGDPLPTDASVSTDGATDTDDELVAAVMALAINDADPNIQTPTTGYTAVYVEDDVFTTVGAQAAYKIVSATGVQSAAWAHDNADVGSWAAAIATYRIADETDDWTLVGSTNDTIGTGAGNEDVTLPGTPAEGDIVIVVRACDNAISSQAINTSGYVDIYNPTAGTSDPGPHVAYKLMGSTPDSVVNISQNGGAIQAVVVQVWRTADGTTPLDGVTPTAATGNSALPNSPAIVPVTDGARVFTVMLLDDDDSASGIAAPFGYGDLQAGDTGQASTTAGATAAIASKVWHGGPVDPSAFTGSSTDAWRAVTFVLRPAAAGGVEEITGTSAVAFTTAGTLKGAGALTGAASVSFTGAGDLNGAAALTGASDLAFTGAATGHALAFIAGTAALAFTGAGTAKGAGALAGTSTPAFTGAGTLKGAGALAGSADVAFAGAGALLGAGALAGSADAAFTGVGALLGVSALAGTADLAFTGAATAKGSGVLAGTAAPMFTGAGVLTATGALTGAAPLAFTGAGALLGVGALAGSASLAFTAAGTLAGVSALTGLAEIAFTGAATAKATGRLAGASALSLSAVAALAGQGRLGGISELVFTGIGDLTGSAAGEITGTAGLDFTGAATAKGAGRLSGISEMAFTATGAMTGASSTPSGVPMLIGL